MAKRVEEEDNDSSFTHQQKTIIEFNMYAIKYLEFISINQQALRIDYFKRR